MKKSASRGLYLDHLADACGAVTEVLPVARICFGSDATSVHLAFRMSRVVTNKGLPPTSMLMF